MVGNWGRLCSLYSAMETKWGNYAALSVKRIQWANTRPLLAKTGVSKNYLIYQNNLTWDVIQAGNLSDQGMIVQRLDGW